MADLSALDRMIKQRIKYRKKHNLKPVLFIIPGYGLGCIDVKKNRYKDLKKVTINGTEIELIGINDKRNPFYEETKDA